MALEVPKVTSSDVVKTIIVGDLTFVVMLEDDFVQVLAITDVDGERRVTHNKRLRYAQWLECMDMTDLLELSIDARRL